MKQNIARSSRSSRTPRSLLVGGLVLVGMVIGSVGATALSGPPDVSDREMIETAADWVGAVPLQMMGEQAPADRELTVRHSPENLGGDVPIDTSTIRLLGTFHEAAFYGGFNERGALCLILEVRSHGVAGTTCATAAQFAETGLSLDVRGPSSEAAGQYQGYLLPNGYDVDQLASALKLNVLTENLAVRDVGAEPNAASESGRQETIRLQSEDGRATVQVHVLPLDVEGY